ncbi:hypothetical protein BN8_05924 [Fibrisoma limi BUZ 3]|uniref:Uncharacterized protein n=1 Tax=Fibrisoma limi BUZ 3 TaxID=1185876 RepID=I2GRN8_9BACT|nr:hypothetical protein BN8_05924 [Fibrisoma limi BUZ 3]
MKEELPGDSWATSQPVSIAPSGIEIRAIRVGGCNTIRRINRTFGY